MIDKISISYSKIFSCPLKLFFNEFFSASNINKYNIIGNLTHLIVEKYLENSNFDEIFEKAVFYLILKNSDLDIKNADEDEIKKLYNFYKNNEIDEIIKKLKEKQINVKKFLRVKKITEILSNNNKNIVKKFFEFHYNNLKKYAEQNNVFFELEKEILIDTSSFILKSYIDFYYDGDKKIIGDLKTGEKKEEHVLQLLFYNFVITYFGNEDDSKERIFILSYPIRNEFMQFKINDLAKYLDWQIKIKNRINIFAELYKEYIKDKNQVIKNVFNSKYNKNYVDFSVLLFLLTEKKYSEKQIKDWMHAHIISNKDDINENELKEYVENYIQMFKSIFYGELCKKAYDKLITYINKEQNELHTSELKKAFEKRQCAFCEYKNICKYSQ